MMSSHSTSVINEKMKFLVNLLPQILSTEPKFLLQFYTTQYIQNGARTGNDPS